MKIIYVSDSTIHIGLSRRNAETLVKMIDQGVGEPVISRKIDGVNVHLSVESDAAHYANRPEHLEPSPSIHKILVPVEDAPALPRPAMLEDEDEG